MPTLRINDVDIEVTDEVKILTDIPKSGVLYIQALDGLVFGVFGADPTINPPSDTPHRWVPDRIHAIVAGPKALAVCATDRPQWQAPKPKPEKPTPVALEDTPEEIARRRTARQQAALERHVLETLTQEYLDSFARVDPAPVDAVPASAVEQPSAYTPDFTIIPEALSRYAEADETAEDFRLRLKSYFQRFGIDEGKNFPGGGEPLTGDEKIQMREIDIMLNSDTGKAARLHDWLFAD